MAKLERTRHPGIYRRGGRYVVVWRHRGKQHKSFHRTLDEAREAKGLRDSGVSRPSTRRAFDDYARAWLDTYPGRTKRGLSDRTRVSYAASMKRWAIPFFDRYKIAEVEPPDVRRFVLYLEQEGLRPTTVRRTLAPLKAMFSTAVEDGHLLSNPTREVRVGQRRDGVQAKGREVRALTRAELARLLGELPVEWRPFFELLAQTGLRISEAVGLECRHVRLGDRPTLLVRQQDYRGDVGELKSDRSRRDVPLSPGTARRMRDLTAGRPETDRLFVTAAATPLSDGNVRRRVLDPAAERAGLPWVTFHSFRHTCASLLIERGRRVEQVSGWLGHSDAGFTLRTYVHLMDDGIGDAAFMDDLAPATLRAVA